MLRLNLRQTDTIRVKLRTFRNIIQIRQRQSESVRLRINQSELTRRELRGLFLRLTGSGVRVAGMHTIDRRTRYILRSDSFTADTIDRDVIADAFRARR